MARQKIPNVRVGEDVPRQREDAPRQEEEVAARREEVRRGKRKTTESTSKRKKSKGTKKVKGKWELSMPTRKATCEQMVDRKHIGEMEVVLRIRERGLQLWFELVEGFIRAMVQEFFENMFVPDAKDYITSMVRGIEVLVNPMIITLYLGCPSYDETMCTFPKNEEEDVYDLRFYADEMFVNPGEFAGLFPVGSLKEEYRLMNKILHFNLYPRGVEKLLGRKEVQLVYAFLHDDIMDVGRFVFKQLVEFRTGTMLLANFSYPAMITQLCIRAGVPEITCDVMTEGLSPISGITASKSNAHSKSPTPYKRPPSLQTRGQTSARTATPPATPPVGKLDKNSFKGKIWKMMKKIFCRQSKIKRTQKEILKTQKQILRRQKFTMDHVTAQIGCPYVSEDEEEEEENEIEEEVSEDIEEETGGDGIEEESE